jgi:transcriptional regulator CtsR
MCYLHLIRQVLKKVIKEAKKVVVELKEASLDHQILVSNVNFNILSAIYYYSWTNDKGKYQPTIWCKSYSYPHFESSLSFIL